MSALILTAEARRSRIRAATSAIKRPAWSRLANEARERAATTLTMAQTITSSSREKPAAALRELRVDEVVIGRFILMDTFNAVLVTESDAGTPVLLVENQVPSLAHRSAVFPEGVLLVRSSLSCGQEGLRGRR